MMSVNRAYLEVWLSGILQGHSIGVPNLLGPGRDKPQQVEDSGQLSMPTPKDPGCFAPGGERPYRQHL